MAQEPIDQILAALMRVRKEVPYLQKDLKVGKYTTIGIENMLRNLRTHFVEQEILTIPEKTEVLSDTSYEAEITNYRGEVKKVMVRNIVVRVTYAIVHSSGQSIGAMGIGEGSDHGDKATPKAMTLAYKAMLRQLFSIETGDQDPDKVHSDDMARQIQREEAAVRRSEKLDTILQVIATTPDEEKLDRIYKRAKTVKVEEGFTDEEWAEVTVAIAEKLKELKSKETENVNETEAAPSL